MILAADIGGTKSRLGIFSAKEGPRSPLAEITYPTASYRSAADLLLSFLNQTGFIVERVCLGIAA